MKKMKSSKKSRKTTIDELARVIDEDLITEMRRPGFSSFEIAYINGTNRSGETLMLTTQYVSSTETKQEPRVFHYTKPNEGSWTRYVGLEELGDERWKNNFQKK